MIITDRTAIETDWRCQESRRFLTEEGGQGIVPLAEVLELSFGIAYARGVEGIALGEDPGACIGPIVGEFRKKWEEKKPAHCDVLEGLLWGFATYLLPRIKQDYEILGIEPELMLAYPPVDTEMLILTRPDIVLRRLKDSTIWVPDCKTTKWKDPEWLDGWPWAIQLHIQAAAVAQARPEWDVQGSLVLGAYKGYEKEGDHYSPFHKAYRNITPKGESWSFRYIRGWERVPTSWYPGGIQAAVSAMPSDVLFEQFPVTQPIFLRQDMLEKVLKERLSRERAIRVWRASPDKEGTRHEVFQHQTSSCKRCGYKEACWNPTVGADPLASGLYVVRTPNHQLELIASEVLK